MRYIAELSIIFNFKADVIKKCATEALLIISSTPVEIPIVSINEVSAMLDKYGDYVTEKTKDDINRYRSQFAKTWFRYGNRTITLRQQLERTLLVKYNDASRRYKITLYSNRFNSAVNIDEEVCHYTPCYEGRYYERAAKEVKSPCDGYLYTCTIDGISYVIISTDKNEKEEQLRQWVVDKKPVYDWS